MLLVEDEHFQEVLTVDKLMLKLLLLEELSLKKRTFDVNIILDLIKLLFLEVERCFLFKNLCKLDLQLLAGLLNLDSVRVEFDLFLLKIDHILFELLSVSINKFTLFL